MYATATPTEREIWLWVCGLWSRFRMSLNRMVARLHVHEWRDDFNGIYLVRPSGDDSAVTVILTS